MADEYQVIRKYRLTREDERYTDDDMYLYENRIVEKYHSNKFGYYLRDPNTREHIAIAQYDELQHVTSVLHEAKPIFTLLDPVNFETDPIGTLYLNLEHNEPCVSTYYSEDSTYMEGIYPLSDYGTGSLKSTDVVYAKYQ